MGTIKEPSLTEDEVVRRYLAGEGRTMIALRAKKPDYWVQEILTRHGVEMRTMSEVQKLVCAERSDRYRQRRKQLGPRRPIYRGMVEGEAAP